MAISDQKYNTARSILASAGSDTAAKSHQKHTGGSGSPDGHGQQLLREARDEFRDQDVGGKNLRGGMTEAHYDAIHKAATTMGITDW